MPEADHTFALSAGLQGGSPISITSEMALMMNSLQVTFSSRYVFSQTNDFTVVETMLASNPSFATGLKSHVS